MEKGEKGVIIGLGALAIAGYLLLSGQNEKKVIQGGGGGYIPIPPASDFKKELPSSFSPTYDIKFEAPEVNIPPPPLPPLPPPPPPPPPPPTDGKTTKEIKSTKKEFTVSKLSDEAVRKEVITQHGGEITEGTYTLKTPEGETATIEFKKVPVEINLPKPDFTDSLSLDGALKTKKVEQPPSGGGGIPGVIGDFFSKIAVRWSLW